MLEASDSRSRLFNNGLPFSAIKDADAPVSTIAEAGVFPILIGQVIRVEPDPIHAILRLGAPDPPIRIALSILNRYKGNGG